MVFPGPGQFELPVRVEIRSFPVTASGLLRFPLQRKGAIQ